MSDPFMLLPRPQRVEWVGAPVALPAEGLIVLQGAGLSALSAAGSAVRRALGEKWELTAAAGGERVRAVVRVDPSQVTRPQGYRLSIAGGRIMLLAHDPAGAFYGAQTLAQLAMQITPGAALPAVRIEDWPDFAHRGVMLDISRDRVPTMATLRQLIDTLAQWKINEVQLYTEHTFAFRNHREVWEHASPISGQEILELDEYCRQRFIELVPNQNSFGHWERWLKYPRYKHLAESPEGFDYPWGGSSPTGSTLCPLEPGALVILEELYDELLPHFSSRQFNVGGDEPWELGAGRSKEECARRGVGVVYLEFLQKIHKLVQRHGRTMQFWGDIIMHHPELIAQVPAGVTALEWGYEVNHPFAEHGKKFADSGVPFYVCPGTSTWSTLGGRTDNAMGNLLNAAENGLANGAVGYLITDWGDNGHMQPLPVSYLGFAYGAAVSWSVQANRGLDLPRALDLFAFHDGAGVMGRLAYDLGLAYRATGTPIFNSTVLGQLLYVEVEGVPKWFAESKPEGWREASDFIKQATAKLPAARMAGPDARQVADEFAIAAAMMQHACAQGAARAVAPGNLIAAVPAPGRRQLADELQTLIAEYRRVWLNRHRPGGLRESAGRLEKLLEVYKGASNA